MVEITEEEFKRFELMKASQHLRLERLGDHWAARLNNLTAYGNSIEEAMDKLQRMSTFQIKTEFAIWKRQNTRA